MLQSAGGVEQWLKPFYYGYPEILSKSKAIKKPYLPQVVIMDHLLLFIQSTAMWLMGTDLTCCQSVYNGKDQHKHQLVSAGSDQAPTDLSRDKWRQIVTTITAMYVHGECIILFNECPLYTQLTGHSSNWRNKLTVVGWPWEQYRRKAGTTGYICRCICCLVTMLLCLFHRDVQFPAVEVHLFL